MTKSILNVVLLCGGAGSRLWPLSKQDNPKQFLKLFNKNSLFQETLLRVLSLQSSEIHINQIVIVTNECYRFNVLEHLESINLDMTKVKIILEPEAKNTAPSLTLAAMAIEEKKAHLLVLPCDHYFSSARYFSLFMKEAISKRKHKEVILFGIEPKTPNTTYGYIHFSGYSKKKNLVGFVEKPEINTAKKMVSSKKFAWNSGIFLLDSEVWNEMLYAKNKKMYEYINNSWINKNVDHFFIRPDKNFFSMIKPDSIDYAVLEKINPKENLCSVYIYKNLWSDLGSFNSIKELAKQDVNKNYLSKNVFALDTKNTMVISSIGNIATFGLRNISIVSSENNVLIFDNKKSEKLPQFFNSLKKNKPELLDHREIFHRPWGHYQILTTNENFQIKLLEIKALSSISLQKHKYRSEHWTVIEGVAKIILEDKIFELKKDQSIFIKKNKKHQIINKSKNKLQIIEVQTGTYFGEDDIVRYEDQYGR